MAKERHELADDPEAELQEMAAIYVGRGLSPDLAMQVAIQLTAKGMLWPRTRATNWEYLK